MAKRQIFEKKVGKELVTKLEEAGLMGNVYDVYNELTDNQNIPTVVARHRALNAVMPQLDPEWKPLTSADMNVTDARVMTGLKYSDYSENFTPAADGVSDGGVEEEQSVKPDDPTIPAIIDKTEPIVKGKQINIPRDVMDRTADVIETIEWVAKNIEQPFCMAVIETAPCAEAVGLLRYYSASDHNKGTFYKEQYARLIPNKTQLSHRGKVDVDGKNVLEAITHIKKGELDFELEPAL